MRVPALKKQLGRYRLETLWLPAGNVLVEATRDGEIVHRETVKNLIPAGGRNVIRDLLGNSGPAPSSVGVGTDSTTTTDTMTSLGAEVFRGVIARRIATASKMTFVFFLAASEANSNTLQEAGIFADEDWQSGSVTTGGGYLFARTVHTPIEKTVSVTVTYTWEIPITTG